MGIAITVKLKAEYMTIDPRTETRHLARTKRRHLSDVAGQAASQQVMLHYLQMANLTDKQHFALYLANDGELDPSPLMQELLQQGKKCYLPTLHPSRAYHMLFMPFDKKTELVANRYGILEPKLDEGKVFPAEQLDVVFTPLVNFDDQGNRLGMGAGFYDRCFAFLKQQKRRETYLIGLAYEFQYLPHIIAEDWDVSLDAVISDKKNYIFSDELRS